MRGSVLAMLALAVFGLRAQTPRVNQAFQMHLRPAEGKVQLDGQLNEAAWKQAARVSDFHQVTPIDTIKAKVRTDVYMTYDDKYLYIAAECFLISEKAYVVESLKRDFNFGNNDNFLVFIDTFDDKTTGFSFGANAAGAQWDGQMFEGAKMNLNWDNKWESATSFNKKSWIFEAAIPFKSIRYKANSKYWGINFSRLDTRAKEKSAWAPVPRQFPTASLAYAGLLVWDKEPPAPKQNISIIPYMLTGPSKNYELGSPTKWKGQVGGDIKVALNSSLNLDMTLNPDFSQVDVDRQQTNLDRFELFYPERRQFFIENSDLFDGFGNETIRPFFSRRIGIAYNSRTGIYEQTPISYGARLSGKLTKDWRIGVLNVQSQAIESKGVPGQNYSMMAFQRKLFARSNVGIFFVNKISQVETELHRRNGFSDYNRNLGLEYNLASANNFWTGKTFYYQSFSPLQGQSPFAHATSLAYKDNHWILVWNHQWVGGGFNPEVGYVPRTDYTSIAPEFGRIFYPKSANSDLFYVQFKLMSINFWNKAGKQTDQTNVLTSEWQFKNRSIILAWAAQDYVRLLTDFDATRMGNTPLRKGTEHRWDSWGINLISSPINRWTVALRNRFGGYYGNGRRTGITGEMGYRFQPFVVLSAAIDYNRIREVSVPDVTKEGQAITRKIDADFWIIRPKIDVTFTNKLFFTTFFQINQQTKNVNLNTRLQWRYKPASDLFLVYTDNYFPEIYKIRNRAVVLKLNYWLNL